MDEYSRHALPAAWAQPNDANRPEATSLHSASIPRGMDEYQAAFTQFDGYEFVSDSDYENDEDVERYTWTYEANPNVTMNFNNCGHVQIGDMYSFYTKDTTKQFTNPTKTYSEHGSHSWHTHCNIPLPPPKIFIGRVGALNDISQCLAINGMAMINGVAGQGKTTTAIQYAYLNSKTYKHIFYVDASTLDSLMLSFTELGGERCLNLYNTSGPRRLVNQRSGMTMVSDWLAAHDDWLLIVDSANHTEVLEALGRKAQASFVPVNRKPRGHVIITSQASTELLQKVQPIESILLNDFTKKEAEDFFTTRWQLFQAGPSNLDMKYLNMLIDRLPNLLPLRLEQISSFIHTRSATFQEYLEQQWDDSDEDTPMESPILGDNTKLVTTAFDDIFARLDEESSVALDILRLLSFCHGNEIPVALLKRQMMSNLHLSTCRTSGFQNSKKADSKALDGGYLEETKPEQLTKWINLGLHHLKSYNLVSLTSDKLHVIVHSEIQIQSRRHMMLQQCRQVLLHLAQILFDWIKEESISSSTKWKLFAHLEKCLWHMKRYGLDLKESALYFALEYQLLSIMILVGNFNAMDKARRLERNLQATLGILGKHKIEPTSTDEEYAAKSMTVISSINVQHLLTRIICLQGKICFFQGYNQMALECIDAALLQLSQEESPDTESIVSDFVQIHIFKARVLTESFLCDAALVHLGKVEPLMSPEFLGDLPESDYHDFFWACGKLHRNKAMMREQTSPAFRREMEAAQKDFQDALALDKDHPRKLMLEVYRIEIDMRLATDRDALRRGIQQLKYCEAKIVEGFGHRHPYAALVKTKLAWLLKELREDLQSALLLVGEALTIESTVYANKNHPRLIATEALKGELLFLMGQRKEALPHLENAYRVFKDTHNNPRGREIHSILKICKVTPDKPVWMMEEHATSRD